MTKKTYAINDAVDTGLDVHIRKARAFLEGAADQLEQADFCATTMLENSKTRPSEAVERDAARYRFIRDMQFGVKGAPQPPQDGGDWWGEVLGNTYGEAFTAVVDAAMSAQSDTEESK